MAPQKRSRSSNSKAATKADSNGKSKDSSSTTSNGPQNMQVGSYSDESENEDEDDDEEEELSLAQRDIEDESSDDSDEEMEDVSALSGGNNTNSRIVNVEFIFDDPKEAHFHSVKQFLLSYLPSSVPFDLSGLANLIVNQVETGTMVCIEGESDVYGFITALSLTRYKSERSIQQIIQYLLKKCPSNETKKEFQTILDTKKVGLVINERMINLPYQLIPPMHHALHEDIEWAITHEKDTSFQFDFFLILSTCSTSTGETKQQQKKKQKATEVFDGVSKFYRNFEDEFLEQDATLEFVFDTVQREQEEERGKGQQQTVVMLIERIKHQKALDTIQKMINS